MKTQYTWKYKPDIQSLVYLADANFLVCKTIYDTLPKDRIKANNFFLLSANNAFYEAIGILHTLLCSTKKEELIIKPLLAKIIDREKKSKTALFIGGELVRMFEERIIDDYPYQNYASYDFLVENNNELISDVIQKISMNKRRSSLQDLKVLKDKFEKENFHKIRHQSFAHKNKLLKEPAGASYLYVENNLIENLGKIIKELRILSYFWFGWEMKNPNMQIINDLKKIL